MASMVLDQLIFDLARFTVRGTFGTTGGRVYSEHKKCMCDQNLRDLVEILFGTLGGYTYTDPNSNSAHSFASTIKYQVPDVLLEIEQVNWDPYVDRSRVSINFDEAQEYGIAMKT
jgi:hypothetical protein